jgi:hypothetical protein
VFVVPGMLVRRSEMACLFDRRGDLTPETQYFEEEEPNPVWAFAQLRRLGLGLVTVSHANLVGLIRIARSSAHASNASGGRSSCRRDDGPPSEYFGDRWTSAPHQGS